MRSAMLMTGFAAALLAGSATAQQAPPPGQGDMDTVQTLGTLRDSTGAAHGTGSKLDWQPNPVKEKAFSPPPAPATKMPDTLARTASQSVDAQIMATPVPADPGGAVAIARPQDQATGAPLRIAPYAPAPKGIKVESKARDGRK